MNLDAVPGGQVREASLLATAAHAWSPLGLYAAIVLLVTSQSGLIVEVPEAEPAATFALA